MEGNKAFYYAGVIVGMVITILIVYFVSKRKKDNAEYDERQIAARGKAYQYGFFTVLASIMALGILLSMNVISTVTPFVVFMCMTPGILIFAVYSIWHDAYISLRTSAKSTVLFFIMIAIVNLIVPVQDFFHGKSLAEILDSPSGISVACAALLLIVSATIAVKALVSRKESGEDEES